MCFDIFWYNELDGVFFEIWQRITKLKVSLYCKAISCGAKQICSDDRLLMITTNTCLFA